MVATPSTMVQLGSKAHPFSLPDPISGKLFEFNKALGQSGSLIAFICNHCPICDSHSSHTFEAV